MVADHDAYIAGAPEELRALLVRLRAELARALPDAEEVIAYKMPGFGAVLKSLSETAGIFDRGTSLSSAAKIALDIARALRLVSQPNLSCRPRKSLPRIALGSEKRSSRGMRRSVSNAVFM